MHAASKARGIRERESVCVCVRETANKKQNEGLSKPHPGNELHMHEMGVCPAYACNRCDGADQAGTKQACMPVSSRKWTCSYIAVVPAAGNIDAMLTCVATIDIHILFALYRRIM